MSDYVKATNFTAKDSLPSGNTGKIVKGTEIDVELTAIASAISSKADSNSPTLTGIPLAPTASSGTNTTQIATTAFVKAAVDTAIQAMYPVGSIYVNATSATNPATLLGFGTWVAFGAGRVMVGLNASDTAFDTAEETGGSKDAIVVAHTHTGTTASSGAHTHTVTNGGTVTNTISQRYSDTAGNINSTGSQTTSSAGAHTHTFTTDSTGSSATNANLPPYIVVRMWKRTA